MRITAIIYWMGVGWYIRYSGLDAEIAQIARDGYDRAVRHTITVARSKAVSGDPGAAQDALEPGAVS